MASSLGGRLGGSGRLLEAPGVDVVGAQRVPGPGGDDQPGRCPGRPIGLQRPPQRPDEGADRADRALRRVLPQVGGEHADRHHPTPRDDQPRQHLPVPRPLQRDRRPRGVHASTGPSTPSETDTPPR